MWLGSATTVGVLIIVSGLSPTYHWYALGLPVIGLASLLTLTATNMYLQTSVDQRVRGRVMALYMTVLMGGTPVGAPLLGWLAELLGPRAPLVGGGLLQLATIGLVILAVRTLRAAATHPAGAEPSSSASSETISTTSASSNDQAASTVASQTVLR